MAALADATFTIEAEPALFALVRELAEEQRQCREYLGRLVALAETQAETHAASARLLQTMAQPMNEEQPQPSIRDFEDYCEAQIGHFLVRIGGVWLDGTPAEDAAIREMIQQRRGR